MSLSWLSLMSSGAVSKQGFIWLISLLSEMSNFEYKASVTKITTPTGAFWTRRNRQTNISVLKWEWVEMWIQPAAGAQHRVSKLRWHSRPPLLFFIWCESAFCSPLKFRLSIRVKLVKKGEWPKRKKKKSETLWEEEIEKAWRNVWIEVGSWNKKCWNQGAGWEG